MKTSLKEISIILFFYLFDKFIWYVCVQNEYIKGVFYLKNILVSFNMLKVSSNIRDFSIIDILRRTRPLVKKIESGFSWNYILSLQMTTSVIDIFRWCHSIYVCEGKPYVFERTTENERYASKNLVGHVLSHFSDNKFHSRQVAFPLNYVVPL